jgi:hypothetical protein
LPFGRLVRKKGEYKLFYAIHLSVNV